jgi:hypothetical protein
MLEHLAKSVRKMPDQSESALFQPLTGHYVTENPDHAML